jgi:prepilin-type N-terminal cleavage/methylation domain-containing protein
MLPTQEHSGRSQSGISSRRKDRGFSMIELLMVCMVGTILTAMAIPQIKSSLYAYRLNSAVAMAKWGIQSTRFQALSKGYPYQVVFTAASTSYQVQNLPSGTTYQSVGTAIPLAAWPMTFSADTTINFKANGFVSSTPSNNFTIQYQGVTASITVSNYGNVTVSCNNGSVTPMC